MTARYPRLRIITRAARELIGRPQLPSLEWTVESIDLRRSDLDRVRLNLVIMTLDSGMGWGGQATLLELFESMAPHFESARIVVRDRTTPAQVARFPGFRLVSPAEDSDEPRQVVSTAGPEARSLAVGSKDIFMSSHWTDSYFIRKRIVPWQAREFDQAPRPMVYVIQDYEPGFYAWSSHYVLARGTYDVPEPAVAVFNTGLLRDYFREQKHTFSREYSFEPKLNAGLRAYHSREGSPPKKRQILVYGRPWTPRNAFTLMVAGLRSWRARYPDAGRWKIISAGVRHQDIDLGGGVAIESVGKLSMERYAQFLMESGLGISLMISPHPSYPPLEMAHFGIRVLTNHFANKDITRLHDNIDSVEDLSPESIGDHLIALCERFEADPEAGYRGESRMPHYLDDSPVFPFIDDLVGDIATLSRGTGGS